MTQNVANGDQITVSFTYVNTGKQTKFPAGKDAKFDDVVNEAYQRTRRTKENIRQLPLQERHPPRRLS